MTKQKTPRTRKTQRTNVVPAVPFTAVAYAREHNLDAKRVRAKIRANRDAFNTYLVRDASTLHTYTANAREFFDSTFANMITRANAKT